MEKMSTIYSVFGLQMLQQFAEARGHNHKINKKIAVQASEVVN